MEGSGGKERMWREVRERRGGGGKWGKGEDVEGSEGKERMWREVRGRRGCGGK